MSSNYSVRTLCAVVAGLFRILLIALALVWPPWDLRADDEFAKHLLDGVFNRREQILSGECHITYSALDKSGGVEVQTKYFAAFDFAESRWRWDVEESTGPLQAKYLESDGVSYFYNADAHSLEKNLPGRDLGLRECGPLDPRLVGLTGAGDLHAHAPYGRIKEIINGFSNGTTKELEDGKVELLYEVGPMSDHWLNLQVYVIDVERLVPLVLETRLRRSDVDVDQSVVLERSTTKWKEMGGALVPVEFETRYMEMGDGNVSSTTRYEFNWESVNEPVPSRRFDYRDFGPFPEGTAIVDTRLGKPVILEIVGHTAGVANTPMPIPQESHVVAWITAAAALALLGVIAAALLARRKRRLGAID